MRSVRFSIFGFVLLALCFLSSKPVFAQIDLDTLPFKHLEVGPFFTAGLSIFQGDVPDGSKTDVHFAFTGGALAAYSFHPHWGFALGLGYDSRGMYFHKQGEDDPNENITLNYLSIRPSIKFKQFLMGINIGIPMSGNIKGSTGFPAPLPSSYESDINTDSLNTMIDIRIEGLLPIVENDNGALYFVMSAAYCVSDAIGKGGFFTPGQTTSVPITKSPIPTVQIGLSYMLAPGGKHH